MVRLNYQEALSWIHSRERFGINPGLSRIEYMLACLGNPHLDLKVIHIAGTNGKGSTAAFTAAVLQEAGYRTGLYTSPYLESFTNRMAVDGTDVAEEALVLLVNKIKPVVEETSNILELGPPTEFEVVTALAFAYFAEIGVDYLVLEVGLGGRLDATNVIPQPLVSTITNISLEHVEILGDTVTKIAREKAGIIKTDSPVLTASQDVAVQEVFRQVAGAKEVPLYILGEDFLYETGQKDLAGQYFNYTGKNWVLKDLFIPLLGEHQVINAATALAGLELAGVSLMEESVRKGLRETFWPGRLEILQKNPLVVIDAAHNPAGIKHLRKALEELFLPTKLVMVLGILDDKPAGEVLQEIIPVTSQLIVTTAIHPTRAAKPQKIAAEAALLTDKPITISEKLRQAITTGYNLLSSEDVLCITGSFYTISEARRLILEEKIIVC